jgi:hypothetical protein
MEISYQLREEDLLALSDDFTSHSTTARRALRRGSLLACFYMVLVAIALWMLTGLIEILVGVITIGVVLAAFIPTRVKQNQRRAMAAIYREGRNRALFLPMTLGVDRDSLSWTSKSGSGFVKFEYIERVRQSPTHLFIYLNVRNAYVIPRDGVISGDFDAFAREVEKCWRNTLDSFSESYELHPV